MATFRFRLETLKKIREGERDERRRRLAEALQALQIVEQKRQELRAEAARVQEQTRRASQPGTVDVNALISQQRYALLLSAQGQQLQEQAARIEDEIERRRAALVEADRQVRVLEKLRERQLAAFLEQQEKRDQKQMDEIALRGVVSRRVDPAVGSDPLVHGMTEN